MSKFVLMVVGAALLAVLGIYFLSPRSSNTSAGTAMKTGDATYQLDKTSVDFGSITVSDVKSADFSLKNTGTDSIGLSHFQTSCDCTSAIVKIGSTVSPEIGMAGMMVASAANWQNNLLAGQTATISVTYNPTKMPVYGVVERTTTFMANSKELTLTVKAFVR